MPEDDLADPRRKKPGDSAFLRIAQLFRGMALSMMLAGVSRGNMGMLGNGLALRTYALRSEEGEEDVDDAVEISSSDFFDPTERPYYFLG